MNISMAKLPQLLDILLSNELEVINLKKIWISSFQVHDGESVAVMEPKWEWIIELMVVFS